MYSFKAPFGIIDIELNDNKLAKLILITDNKEKKKLPHDIQNELECYFHFPHHSFNLDLSLKGTPFQQTVWEAIKKIPHGTTMTYKMVAEQLKTSPRAVGNACRANPIPIVIPCHRVIAQKGLGGFFGDTTGKLIEIKKWLLQHEGL